VDGTYGGEEFGALVEAALDLADNLYEDLNTAQKARVKELSSLPAARSRCSGTRPGGWKSGQSKVSAVRYQPSAICRPILARSTPYEAVLLRNASGK